MFDSILAKDTQSACTNHTGIDGFITDLLWNAYSEIFLLGSVHEAQNDIHVVIISQILSLGRTNVKIS